MRMDSVHFSDKRLQRLLMFTKGDADPVIQRVDIVLNALGKHTADKNFRCSPGPMFPKLFLKEALEKTFGLLEEASIPVDRNIQEPDFLKI